MIGFGFEKNMTQYNMAPSSVPASRVNAYLLRSALVAALGGLLFGFDTAVISGTTRALTDAFRLTPGLLGLTVVCGAWPCCTS